MLVYSIAEYTSIIQAALTSRPKGRGMNVFVCVLSRDIGIGCATCKKLSFYWTASSCKCVKSNLAEAVCNHPFGVHQTNLPQPPSQ